MLKPTKEQAQLIKYFKTGKSLKIEACAGSGKTSTLLMMASETTRPCLYLAFNAAIKEEASKKFPKYVTCYTSHGLAHVYIKKYYNRRGRMMPKLLKEALGLEDKFEGLSTNRMLERAIQGINNFCLSADPVLGPIHFPQFKIADDRRQMYERKLLVAMQNAWRLMCDEDSDLPVTYDFCLKLWSMEDPGPVAEIVFLDEAQDANALLLHILKRWQEQGVQVVFVGDRFQQIYSWRGAVNAMETIKTDHTGALTRSFRYGEAIADVANTVLIKHRGVHSNIQGHEIDSQLVEHMEAPKAYLCRTNAVVIEQLVKLLDKGIDCAIAGGVDELLAMLKDARRLQAGQYARSKDLRSFDDWEEVVDHAELEIGQDLKPFIRLVEHYGVAGLESLVKCVEEHKVEEAEVVLSTAHKSKGLEFESVKLAGDFYPKYMAPDKPHPLWSEEEAHLLYVAVTRAVKYLDVSECRAVLEAMELETPQNLQKVTLTTQDLPSFGELSEASLAKLVAFAKEQQLDLDDALSLLLQNYTCTNRQMGLF